LKILDIVQKIWAPFRKLFAPPGVPSCLRAWSSPKCFPFIWMFLFSPKFEWSFSHLPKFNWSCWTTPKCSWFTQMFQILPKTWMNLFSWPKFDESCWNYHMIPVHSRAVSILPSRVKRNGKIVSDYFTVFPIICRRFGHYFALVGKINPTSLTRECSCILRPNVENFCPNNGQFFSFGDATASPASPCRTLMTIIQAQITLTWNTEANHNMPCKEDHWRSHSA